MAQKTLTTSYLARLSNANHDGVTQQIDDRLAAFETDNTMFLNAATAVHAARQAEDIAFKRFSGKDFASDDLKREDTDNTMFLNAATAVHAARQAEDIAFKRFSGKDFASDDLKREDRLEDQYMSTIRAMLNALTLLPETEPLRRKAEVAVQVFKDFQFQINDGFEAEARSTTVSRPRPARR